MAWWKLEKIISNVQQLLTSSTTLVDCPEYNTGDLVHVRCVKYLKPELWWLLCEVIKCHPTSGVYTLRVCREPKKELVLNKYELCHAMNL